MHNTISSKIRTMWVCSSRIRLRQPVGCHQQIFCQITINNINRYPHKLMWFLILGLKAKIGEVIVGKGLLPCDHLTPPHSHHIQADLTRISTLLTNNLPNIIMFLRKDPPLLMLHHHPLRFPCHKQISIYTSRRIMRQCSSRQQCLPQRRRFIPIPLELMIL